MTRKTVGACAAALALFALSGCGTFINTSPEVFGRVDDDSPAYGGVRQDARCVGACLKESVTAPDWNPLLRVEAFSLGAYVLCVDLPLTLVGDTLTLPHVLANPWYDDHQPAKHSYPESERAPPETATPTAASQPASP